MCIYALVIAHSEAIFSEFLILRNFFTSMQASEVTGKYKKGKYWPYCMM